MTNYYFILWMAMTICTTILLYYNNKQKNIIKKYESLINKNGGLNTKIAQTTSDKSDALNGNVAKLEATIKEFEKDLEESQKDIDYWKKETDKLREEKRVLRKQSADFIPMKSMADYKEKIWLLSEQAEDMFGLYIDKVMLTRCSGMCSRFWKIDIEVNTTDVQSKPKDKEIKEET